MKNKGSKQEPQYDVERTTEQESEGRTEKSSACDSEATIHEKQSGVGKNVLKPAVWRLGGRGAASTEGGPRGTAGRVKSEGHTSHKRSVLDNDTHLSAMCSGDVKQI